MLAISAPEVVLVASKVAEFVDEPLNGVLEVEPL